MTKTELIAVGISSLSLAAHALRSTRGAKERQAAPVAPSPVPTPQSLPVHVEPKAMRAHDPKKNEVIWG